MGNNTISVCRIPLEASRTSFSDRHILAPGLQIVDHGHVITISYHFRGYY